MCKRLSNSASASLARCSVCIMYIFVLVVVSGIWNHISTYRSCMHRIVFVCSNPLLLLTLLRRTEKTDAQEKSLSLCLSLSFFSLSRQPLVLSASDTLLQFSLPPASFLSPDQKLTPEKTHGRRTDINPINNNSSHKHTSLLRIYHSLSFTLSLVFSLLFVTSPAIRTK